MTTYADLVDTIHTATGIDREYITVALDIYIPQIEELDHKEIDLENISPEDAEFLQQAVKEGYDNDPVIYR